MSSFADLSDDVLFLIVNYLPGERTSVLSTLRLVCKRFRSFAESVTYRTVVLDDTSVLQEQYSYRCIERLHDPSDSLRHHVRFLHVKSFKGDEESFCLNTQLLVTCLDSIRRLDTLSWEAATPMNDVMLKRLHQRHPNAELCASVRSLNQSLLKSPQLRRLKVSIPCSDVVHPGTMDSFEQLKQMLGKLNSLRAFSLDVHQDHQLRLASDNDPSAPSKRPSSPLSITRRPRRAFDPESPSDSNNQECPSTLPKVQLPIQSQDRFVALEELSFEATTYVFDAEHCRLLRDCIDWSRLRRLKLSSTHTELFFLHLIDCAPQLQSLDFAHYGEKRSIFPTARKNELQACSHFVSSISTLREIVIRCDEVDTGDPFWDNLARVHGETLEHLSIQPRTEGLEPPSIVDESRFYQLLGCFVNLTMLSLTLPRPNYRFCSREYCSNCHHTMDTMHIRYLPIIRSLHNLHLSVRGNLASQTNYRSDISDYAQCVIKAVWTAYSYEEAHPNLESVDLEVWRWEPSSPHPDEIGLPRTAHIDKTVFTSHCTGLYDRVLAIKAQHKDKVVNRLYDEVVDIHHRIDPNIEYGVSYKLKDREPEVLKGTASKKPAQRSWRKFSWRRWRR